MTTLRTGGALEHVALVRPGARRLLVLAHGVGGNESSLRALAEAASDDTTVVLPRAPLAMGPGQFGWFQVAFGADGPRPDLDAAERARVRLASFVEECQTAFGIPPAGTLLAGFSQGGIMSASVALTQPELLAGFGVLSGRILPELEGRVAPREALAGLRAFIGHGIDDTKLPVDWAHRASAWLGRLGIPHQLRVYPGDHGIHPDMRRDFLTWCGQATGDPVAPDTRSMHA